jgi:hypothetical protein
MAKFTQSRMYEMLGDISKKKTRTYKQGGEYLSIQGENHRVYKNANGDIIVNHPQEDKGKWDTINLTDKANANTIAEGVAATKKWHRENPTMIEKQYGGLHKFVGGGDPGDITCPKDYEYNYQTKYCELIKKTKCPDNFTFDKKSGRCISNYQISGKTTVQIAPVGTDNYVTARPDQLTSEHSEYWPKDLNIEEIDNPVYFPETQEYLRVSHPNYKNKYEGDYITGIKKYPDLNYKVVIDPSKPEGFNKSENIYYVKSENTHQAKKYKEWESFPYEKDVFSLFLPLCLLYLTPP